MIDELCIGMNVKIVLANYQGENVESIIGTVIAKRDQELVLERSKLNPIVIYSLTTVPYSVIGGYSSLNPSTRE